jgi:IclR family transcriptional regulator, KDG regulon repressor
MNQALPPVQIFLATVVCTWVDARSMAYTVSAVQDSLVVLMIVARHPSLGVSEIARLSRTTKARAFRFLATFESSGFVQREKGGTTYVLGPAALILGHAAQEQMSLIKIAQRYLDELSLRFNERAALLIRDGLESVCVAQTNSTHDVRVEMPIGSRRALHAGASGKVLTAFSDPEQQLQVLQAGLPKIAPNTITSKTQFRQELQNIFKLGYATSVSEGASDVVAIAAPVFGSDGTLLASLSVSQPASRAPKDLSIMARVVCDAAQRLSTDLGWQMDLSGKH